MKLFILGATGGTGLQLVPQAAARGHVLTAFGRAAAPAPAASVIGEVRDAKAMAAAMAGHDAVVFVVGPRGTGPTTLYSDTMKATLEAMQSSGVKRLVAVSMAALFPGAGGVLGYVVRFFLRHLIPDALAMEALVRASGVEWTVLRPPRLTDKASSGHQVAVDALPAGGMSIARADLATAVLDAVESPARARTLLGVAS